MGQPVEGSVYRLFQGVSRQPDPLRLEGQVEEAVNVWMSVVSGGFEPRPGSELFFSTTAEDTSRPFIHAYRRDNDEDYLFIIQGGKLRIFNRDGVEIYSLSTNYLNTPDPINDLKAVTAGDVTYIVNSSVVTAYTADTKNQSGDYAAISCVKGDATYGYWRVEVTIGTNTYTASTADKADTSAIIQTLAGALNIPTGEATVTAQGSTMIIENHTSNEMRVTTEDFWGDEGLVTVHKEVDSTSDLPAIAKDTMMVSVGSDPDTQVWMEFEATDRVGGTKVIGRGQWVEAVAPGSRYKLDSTTMPIAFRNTAKDSFAFESLTWEDRRFGSEGDIFEPAFIGQALRDITFHRDRLILISGENIDCSTQGEYYNFFPKRSTEVLDTDPFSRTASSRNVNFLYHAVPFRSQLFVMSENGQFELRGDPVITPKTATLELATQYQAEPQCPPVVMGSELYFAATIDQNVTTLFEYYFQEASVSHTATNATIQVENYVPGPSLKLVVDSVTNTLFLLQDKTPNVLYVYKTFWDGTEKRQSSWSRWEFDFNIENIAMFRDRLLVVTQKDGNLFAYQIPLSNSSPLLENLPSQYHLDSTAQASTLTKDLTANQTTATFSQPFIPNSSIYCVLVAGDDSRIVLGEVQADGVTVVIPEAESFDYDVYAGYPFESYVELSKLLPKDSEGRSVRQGRTQLKRVAVDYEKSAFFDVTWDYPGRTEKHSPFNSYEKTDSIDVGQFPQRLSGVHEVKLRGRSDLLSIRIGSDRPYPYRITGIRWKGTYHDKYGG